LLIKVQSEQQNLYLGDKIWKRRKKDTLEGRFRTFLNCRRGMPNKAKAGELNIDLMANTTYKERLEKEGYKKNYREVSR
jgi:hypothetical protein